MKVYAGAYVSGKVWAIERFGDICVGKWIFVVWVVPEYTFMGLHEGGSGWVAVFGGRVWLIGFRDLRKVLAYSYISHWMVEGSWQQQAKSQAVRNIFLTFEKEMSSRMGEVVDGRKNKNI